MKPGRTPRCDTAYLDCFSGISGDMMLGALIACGLEVDALRMELDKLDLEPFDLVVSARQVQAFSATSVTVVSRSGQSFRNLPDLIAILENSSLDRTVVRRSIAVLSRLARAEALVHGKDVDEIHFHEVGALDTIVDVVGVVSGLQHLGIRSLHCSPLPLSRGFVRCAHGELPLPAPAVCRLLAGLPVYGVETDRELVTPTGAALAAELADAYGALPPMRLQTTGYGAGDHPGTEDRPNLLRLMTGHGQAVEESQQVEIVETHLDDWSPEGYPHLCTRLFAARALDVSLTPIHMKKGRPGFCLQVICRPADSWEVKNTILSETTAIGLRFRHEQRLTLPRRQVALETPWGVLAAKRVEGPTGPVLYPEYEECRAAAAASGIPLEQIYRHIFSLRPEDY